MEYTKIINKGLLSPVFNGQGIKVKTNGTSDMVPDIDSGFLPEPEMADKLLSLFDRVEKPLWIYGPAGTGKTEMVYHLAAITGRAVYTQTVSGDTESTDFTGVMGVSPDGGTTTVYSALIQSMIHNNGEGAICVIPEMDIVSPECNSVLNTLLDNSRMLTIPHSGEVIKAGPMFKLVVTANSAGAGDNTGRYPVLEQSAAFMSRFIKFSLGEHDKTIKERILLSRFPEMDSLFAEKLAEFSAATESAAKAEEFSLNGEKVKVQLKKWVSTRELLGWAEIINATDVSLSEALDYQLAFTDNGFERDAEVIASLGKTLFGGNLWEGSL